MGWNRNYWRDKRARENGVRWESWEDEGFENAEKYFARLARRLKNDGLELHCQLALSGDMTLKNITQLSAAELAGRNLAAGLDNFYKKYTKGPYTVRLRDVAGVKAESPLLSLYSHAVMDNENMPVIAGTQEECARFAEEMNVEYAKSIMVKDTPAEKKL